MYVMQQSAMVVGCVASSPVGSTVIGVCARMMRASSSNAACNAVEERGGLSI